MSDVAISYDSTQREYAIKIAAQLNEAGLTTWMDEAYSEEIGTASELSGIGIAVGAHHRDEITEAFLAASAVLILDTPRWRSQDYCQWEYHMAERAGKRVFVLPVDSAFTKENVNSLRPAQLNISDGATYLSSLEDFTDRFQEGLIESQAQSELLMEWYKLRGKKSKTDLNHNPEVIYESSFWMDTISKKSLKRMSADSRLINSARIIISKTSDQNVDTQFSSENNSTIHNVSIPVDDGLTGDLLATKEEQNNEPADTFIEPAIENLRTIAKTLIELDLKAHNRRRLSIISLGTVVVVLAISSIFFMQASFSNQRVAESNQSIQQSRALSQQSMSTTNTYQKRILANEAMELAQTPEAKAAIQAAAVQSAQVERYSIEAGATKALSLNPDGSKFVVTYAHKVLVYDNTTGELLYQTKTEQYIGGRQIGVSPDATYVAVATTDGELVAVDMQTSKTEIVSDEHCRGFTVDSTGNLWLTYDDGTITRRALPWKPNNENLRVATEEPATAIAVSNSVEQLSVLTKSGQLLVFSIKSDTLKPLNSIKAYDSETESHAILGENTISTADVLLPAGSNVIAMRMGDPAFYQAKAGSIKKANTFNSEVVRQLTPLPASLGDHMVTYYASSNSIILLPESNYNPLAALQNTYRHGGFKLASTEDGSKLIRLSLDGMVELVHTGQSTQQQALVLGVLPLPLQDQTLSVGIDGVIYGQSGNVISDLQTNIVPMPPVTTLSHIYLLSGEGKIIKIDRDNSSSDEIRWTQSESIVDTGSGRLTRLSPTGPEACPLLPKDSSLFVIDSSNSSAKNDNLASSDITVREFKIDLAESEFIDSAAINANCSKAAVITSQQRLLCVDLANGDIIAERAFGVFNWGSGIMFNADDNILATSMDCRVCLFDQSLNLLSSRILNSGVSWLMPSQDLTTVLLFQPSAVAEMIDSSTLQTIQSLSAPRGTSGGDFFAFGENNSTLWHIETPVSSYKPGESKLQMYKHNLYMN